MICLIDRFFKNSSGAKIQGPLVAEGQEIEAVLVSGIERLSQGWQSGRGQSLLVQSYGYSTVRIL